MFNQIHLYVFTRMLPFSNWFDCSYAFTGKFANLMLILHVPAPIWIAAFTQLNAEVSLHCELGLCMFAFFSLLFLLLLLFKYMSNVPFYERLQSIRNAASDLFSNHIGFAISLLNIIRSNCLRASDCSLTCSFIRHSSTGFSYCLTQIQQDAMENSCQIYIQLEFHFI